MYEDYAFGSRLPARGPAASRAGGRRTFTPARGTSRLAERGHRRWLASVRALRDDFELDKDRLTNWGDRLPTRVIIRIMIAHDLYHAGEINHLRALLQSTDRWPYD